MLSERRPWRRNCTRLADDRGEIGICAVSAIAEAFGYDWELGEHSTSPWGTKSWYWAPVLRYVETHPDLKGLNAKALQSHFDFGVPPVQLAAAVYRNHFAPPPAAPDRVLEVVGCEDHERVLAAV